MDDERVIQLFFSTPSSVMFILRLSFVTGGGPFFLACDSQFQIMRRQMEEPVTQIDMGWGEARRPRPASHVWCLSRGPHPPCQPPRWCWQKKLLDTNPLGTVTQKYETERGMSVKDEWLNEWRMMYQRVWNLKYNPTISAFNNQSFIKISKEKC